LRKGLNEVGYIEGENLAQSNIAGEVVIKISCGI